MTTWEVMKNNPENEFLSLKNPNEHVWYVYILAINSSGIFANTDPLFSGTVGSLNSLNTCKIKNLDVIPQKFKIKTTKVSTSSGAIPHYTNREDTEKQRGYQIKIIHYTWHTPDEQ